MSTYGPQVTLTRLFRKVSKAGGSYFTGVMGGAKVLLLKSKDTTEEGTEIWNLVVQERPPKGDGARSNSRSSQDATDGQERAASPDPTPGGNAYAAAKGRREWQAPGHVTDSRPADSAPVEDPLPF